MSRIWTRRRFGRAAALAPLGVPFLSHFARAEEVAPRRVIFLMAPNDCLDRSEWGIGSQESDVALPTTMPSYLEPLSDMTDRIVMLGDLYKSAEHESHCPQSLLTGVDTDDGQTQGMGNGISVDQFIAQEIRVEAATFGVMCIPNDNMARWSFLGPAQPVDPIMDPAIAFDRYFADFMLDPAELEAKRKQRRSLLDRVAGDLTRFQSQLADHQRPRVQAHLDAVRKLETAIDDQIVASCDPGSPMFGQDAVSNEAVPRTLQGLIDVMVQLIACDMTRVGTLQFGRAGAGEMAPVWPDAGINIDADFHFGLSHRYWDEPGTEATADRIASEKWITQHLFRYLLGELQARTDVDGRTLLDNTLVVYLHEMGSNHNAGDHCAILAGGSDWLRTGRFISMPGRSINDVLTTACVKMGVDVDAFGNPEYNDGPISI